VCMKTLYNPATDTHIWSKISIYAPNINPAHITTAIHDVSNLLATIFKPHLTATCFVRHQAWLGDSLVPIHLHRFGYTE
jgi:hypothetical protein